MRQYIDHIKAFSHDARFFLIATIILACGTAAPVVFGSLYFERMGYDRSQIGWITTANQIGAALGTIPAALAIDRLGRRRAILIGALSSLLAGVGAVTSQTYAAVVFWQLVGGVGNVLYAMGVVPLLAQVSNEYERTTLFTTHEGLLTLSLFFGSGLFGRLTEPLANALTLPLDSAETYRAILILSVVIRLLGLLPLAKIRDKKTESKSQKPEGSEQLTASDTPTSAVHRPTSMVRYLDPRVWFGLQTPIFKVGLPLLMVYFAGSLIFPFLTLFLKDRFDASDQLVGDTWGFINLSIGMFTLLSPFLVQRIGRRASVMLGVVVSGVCIAIMGFASNVGVVITTAILRAGLFNFALPIYRAIVIDRAPTHEHTFVALVLSTAANIGATFAPPISGRAQNAFGYAPVFTASSVIYLLSVFAFAWATKFSKNPEKIRGNAKV